MMPSHVYINLAQKNAKHVFEVAVPGLNNQLFSLLDTDPIINNVKDIRCEKLVELNCD